MLYLANTTAKVARIQTPRDAWFSSLLVFVGTVASVNDIFKLKMQTFRRLEFALKSCTITLRWGREKQEPEKTKNLYRNEACDRMQRNENVEKLR